MSSPFPCSPVIRECSLKKNPDRKKKSFEILLIFLFSMKVDFFLPQTAQSDKIINLFCLAFLTLELFVRFPLVFM